MMGHRILICDDETEILDLLGIILGKRGYKVETLEHLDGLMETALSFNPELVLMDLHMPDINGMEGIKMLRSNEATRDIPVVIISANTNARQMADDLDVDDVIIKPFDISTVLEIVKKYTNLQTAGSTTH